MEYDAESWRIRSLGILALVSGFPSPTGRLAKEASQFAAKVRPVLESGSDSIPGLDFPLCRQIAAEVAKGGNGSDQQFLRAWLEFTRAYDEYSIRKAQPFHFLMHTAIREVEVQPASDFDVENKWSFSIQFVLESERAWDAICGKERDGKSVRLSLEESIQGEIQHPQCKELERTSGRTVSFLFCWSVPGQGIIPWSRRIPDDLPPPYGHQQC